MNWCLMLTYNSLSLTRVAVTSVLNQDIPTNLLVMDDGSTDGTLAFLRTLQPRVQIASQQRAGVSRLWNQGLTHLFEVCQAEAVLVLNNDLELRSDTLRLLLEDGGQFVTCVGTSSGALFPGNAPKGERRPHPDFSAFLIRRTCWHITGKFDETMKCYASDGDMHLRMHKAGIEAYCLDIPFYHYASGTLKQASEEDRQRILKQAEKDRFTFVNKWGVPMGSPEYYAMFSEKGATA